LVCCPGGVRLAGEGADVRVVSRQLRFVRIEVVSERGGLGHCLPPRAVERTKLVVDGREYDISSGDMAEVLC
jgi:hypothetical protein